MVARSCLVRRTTQLSPLQLHTLSRPFHSTSAQRDEQAFPNHYETLNVSPNASPAEVKKQFYTLSKSHHPDLHPNDPAASQRFVKISEAYATLSSPDKRARYDRDFFRSQQSSPVSTQTPTGSHSSRSTPFGGRPASGLSRRRTQFRGPPPSFYRSGGWGQYGEKRERAQSEASHTQEAQGQAASNTGGTTAGTGPGGFAEGFHNDVPHFDHRGHYRTQSNISQRAQRRVRRDARLDDAERDAEGGGVSTFFNFMWVSGMLIGVFYMTGAFNDDSGRMRAQFKAQDRQKVASGT